MMNLLKVCAKFLYNEMYVNVIVGVKYMERKLWEMSKIQNACYHWQFVWLCGDCYSILSKNGKHKDDSITQNEYICIVRTSADTKICLWRVEGATQLRNITRTKASSCWRCICTPAHPHLLQTFKQIIANYCKLFNSISRRNLGVQLIAVLER